MGEVADVLEDARGSGRSWNGLRIAVVVAVAYYVAARIGMSFTFEPIPHAVLWPPNAILFGCLVLIPPRRWWVALAGAAVGHFAAELQHSIPPLMVVCWFLSNTAEAVIGASMVRYLSDGRGLASLRGVLVFLVAATTATFFSSFLDVSLVRLTGWSDQPFEVLWQTRFFSNILASLTIVPVVMNWGTTGAHPSRWGTRRQVTEATALVAGLFAVSVAAFDYRADSMHTRAALLYLPVPFLIWAALRFGSALTSAAYAIVVFVVLWGAAHGRGPFLVTVSQQDAVPIQLFLASIAIPLMLLAAAMEERRYAERRLRASEELFSTAFHHSPVGIMISRRSDGAILEANERWLRLLGYPERPRWIAPLADHLRGPDRKVDPQDGHEREVELQDCNGELHTAFLSTAQVELRGEPCQINLLRDITPQRRAEREFQEQRHQLTHLTRVASLSAFSSTIAHELNQPLTAILSNAQAALRYLAREPLNVAELRTILMEIAEADKRAGLLIHHLRLLMKKGEEEFQPVVLNHLVAEVLDFVRGEFLLRNVEVRTSYAPDLPLVNGDRVQLQQVILNLVFNACEAMQEQPRDTKVLSISTSPAANGGAQLLVTDTGPGIPADRLERVFEPFYSTKNHGMGMGLAICRSIVQAHGGLLTADSREGEGATFRLLLPRAVPQPRPASTGRAAQREEGTTPTATAS